MRLDPIVDRRFRELHAKAEAIAAAKVLDFTNEEGQSFFKVSTADYKAWATSALSLLQRTFGENAPHYRNLFDHYKKFDGWFTQFADSFGIFRAAAEDYSGGYLFNVRTLAKAEVLADAITQAKELIAAHYKDPACVLARVALESALKDLAARHGVAEAKLEKMNTELCRVGVYNMAKQKQVTAWADIGNKAAHGDWSAYTDQDAQAMVLGVEALIADL